ncbi:hypothetical protein TIFTF001_036284 [Ficus carica]|uniref:Retrotransposon gag domain-containing protein n=1 Tax=Ficus carica TaxID=3494 RepID=A0AA88E401_FICCA|nr:hypothetical protein TIFTF001_036284 [Ficus carica]
MPGTMNSFKQLSDAFSAVFLNAKTLKKETSYLFRIKQGENEPLKGYMDRFDKTIMQAIVYDVPPTFAHLRGIAQKHAEAEEYIKGRNFLIRETSQPTKKNKPKKDRVGQTGAATEKATCKVEAVSKPKTPARRFRQYTPMVATAEHVINQIS